MICGKCLGSHVLAQIGSIEPFIISDIIITDAILAVSLKNLNERNSS
jgi:hypothetical protein